MSIFSSVNSKKSPIGNNSDNVIVGGNWVGDTYTGQWDVNDFPYAKTYCKITGSTADIFFQFSNDGGATLTSSYPPSGFPLPDGFNRLHGSDKGEDRAYRTVIVCHDSNRTAMELLTTYSIHKLATNAPISEGVTGDMDSQRVAAVIHGQNKDDLTDFIPVKTTANGEFRTSIVSALIDFEHDSYLIVDSGPTTDRIDYYRGGLAGTKVAEISVTYQTTSKNEVMSTEKTII